MALGDLAELAWGVLAYLGLGGPEPKRHPPANPSADLPPSGPLARRPKISTAAHHAEKH